jgi:tyrosine-protein phosphatase SIW14
LVTEEKNAPSSTYKDFIATRGINHKVVLIEPNKDGAVNTNLDKLCEAILFVLSPQNHPVYIHCNQGKHRTGCVVACLRLCQQWPIDEVLEEYLTYARGKEREGDIALIKSFDPSLVFDYAKTHNMLDSFDTRERVDSFTNIFHLASNLPAHNIALLDDKDRSSELSEVSDETLEIYRSHSWYPETITRDFIRSSLRGTQSSASSITESTVSSLSASETGADHDVSPMSLTDPVDNSPATAGDSMRTID